MLYKIKLEDDCGLPMIGINIREEHEEWKEQLQEVLQQKGRYIEVPASGHLSKAAMRTILKYACENYVPRQEFTIATSIMVPENVCDAVAVVKKFATFHETYVDLLYLENPVGLKGSNPMKIYNTSSDGSHPHIRKAQHMFKRGSDGRLKVTPNITQNLNVLWRVLERELVDPAHVRSLGLRHFGHHQVEELMKEVDHRPVAVQAEVNLYCEQADLRHWCRKNNIPLVAIHPYGNPHHHSSKDCPVLWEHPKVVKLAKNIGFDSKVILSRHILQNHLRLVYDNQDLLQPIFLTEDVWRFYLTQGQMYKLAKLNGVIRHPPLSKYELMCVIDPFWPFCYIEEPEDNPVDSSDCEEDVDAPSESTIWSSHDTTDTTDTTSRDETSQAAVQKRRKKRGRKHRRCLHQSQTNISTDTIEWRFKNLQIIDSKGSH